MSEHTKEPWEAFTECPGECCWNLRQATEDENGDKEEISFPEMSGEDARRIVACVNACAGVPQDWLESALPGSVQNVRDERDVYKQQRDKLLAALEGVARELGIDFLREEFDSARAAIAAVKGAETRMDAWSNSLVNKCKNIS